MRNLGIFSLYFAWLIACIATLGSLYFSEVMHLEPCHLCWYQRIAIFPLAFILGAAFYRGYTQVGPLVYPLIIAGLLISLYHIFLEETEIELVKLCGAGPSCGKKLDIGLGLITPPMLATIAFFLIGTSLLIAQFNHFSKTQGKK